MHSPVFEDWYGAPQKEGMTILARHGELLVTSSGTN